MMLPPASAVICSIRPSTCAGTPATIVLGGEPSRDGQLRRTRSWLPPMPPEVTITACACSSKSPVSTRELAWPRSMSDGSRILPRTPSTTPPVVTSSSTRCRNLNVTSPRATASRTRRSNGSTTPGPVPQVRWNRGTELPWPVAVPSPRSAQPTTGKIRWPISRSQARFSPCAKCTYASAHRRGQWSSSRSNPALPCQSCQARSNESLMPSRRCSGVSTMNSPPSDQNACPPRLCSGSWSSSITLRPASASSAVATRPARPAPTTMTSASMPLRVSYRTRRRQSPRRSESERCSSPTWYDDPSGGLRGAGERADQEADLVEQPLGRVLPGIGQVQPDQFVPDQVQQVGGEHGIGHPVGDPSDQLGEEAPAQLAAGRDGGVHRAQVARQPQQRPLEPVLDDRRLAFDQRLDHAGEVTELHVDQRPGHARLACDPVDRRRVEALGRHQRASGVEQLCAPFGRSHPPRHRPPPDPSQRTGSAPEPHRSPTHAAAARSWPPARRPR